MQKIKATKKTVSKELSKFKKVTHYINDHEILRFICYVLFYGYLITLMLVGLFLKTPWLIVNLIAKVIGWGIALWFIDEEFPAIIWKYRRRYDPYGRPKP